MVRTPKKSLTRGAQKPIRINKSRVAPLSSSVQVGAQSRPGRSKRCFLMNMIRMVEAFNLFLAVLFTLAYAYQLVYLFLGLIRRKHWKQPEAAQLHRYAAVISARNEAGVIGELIHTLKQQNYPTDLLDVYVVADNCTDDTAQVSRRAGAIVYERFNQHKKGKGYALDYLFRTLAHEGRDQYDGYLIFDADNLVDPNFVSEMNKVFDSGNYGAITCYRNSRNFGANWISAGYAIWFLREARFLNFPRMLLGSNCHVSGTGFLISADVIRENGGWPYHLLTEDIEFSVSCALKGRRIGYCDKAVIYDEQPTAFRQSWDQRLRWSKGFYQVNANYSGDLVRGFCQKPSWKSWSCYDMFMTVAPGILLTLVTIAFNLVVCLACWGQPSYIVREILSVSGSFLLSTVASFYLGLLLYGILTVLCEWDQIQIPTGKKFLYVFTFPLFMFTYIPISLAALVKKVEWKPIYHTGSRQSLGKAA